MKGKAALPTYRPPGKKASNTWLVTITCTIGAALLAVMIAAQAASADPGHERGAGWFQRCSLAKKGYFDPIVYPDTPPPVGHRHLFFGSTAISHNSRASDLRAGGTTCGFEEGSVEPPDGGNRSSYWIPDLKLRNGEWASAWQLTAYYRKGASSVNANDVRPFPTGLKMVIHDNNRQTKVSWFCNSAPNDGVGTNGIFRERPYDCNPDGLYPHLSVQIRFPHCGTGAADSRDHISHMVYAGASGCPSSHPIEFPQLSIAAKFDTSRGAGSRLAGGEDPATGFHADYFDGWQARAQENFLETCIRGGINCSNGDKLPPQ